MEIPLQMEISKPPFRTYVLTHGTEDIWKNDKELFCFSSITRRLRGFSSFNLASHAEKATYYTSTGYLVRFENQAILICTIENNYNRDVEKKTTYNITLKNINCKTSNCCRAEGSVFVHHKRSTVTRLSWETSSVEAFEKEFFISLRDFITQNKDFGWEHIQRLYCGEKSMWINTSLMKILYSIFNDGRVLNDAKE